MRFIIYANVESLTKKIDGCANNPQNSSTTNRCAYSLHLFNANNLGIWSHRKQTYLISRKRLYEKALWIFKRTRKKYNWLWKENMLPLTKKELKSHAKCVIFEGKESWKSSLKT